MVAALALHPAQRRKLAQKAAPAHRHEVDLRPLGGPGNAMIVGATEQDFVRSVLADLASDGWREALATRRALRKGGDDVLELTHPVHRRFHLVLYELVCRQPGLPPVDPRALDGMGLVLRRRSGNAWLGWMHEGARSRGWLSPNPGDPDPTRRPRARAGGAGAIDAMIAARRPGAGLVEQVTPLFVAPAKVCQARGRTILYGVVPLASGERSEAPARAPDYNALDASERQSIVGHLSSYLKPRAQTDMPHAGARLGSLQRPLSLPADAVGEDGRYRSFGIFLQQLVLECDAFGGGAAARGLTGLFAQLALPMERDGQGRVTRTMAADAFLRAAALVLLGDEGGDDAVTMPLWWPAMDELGGRLTEAALNCLSARFAEIVPQQPKFEGRGGQYAVSAFVRVRGADGCPSRLMWSPQSAPFRILPWWDGDGPPTRVSLPQLADLRRIKPNVSFELPPSLAGLLQGDMKKLSDGENPGGGVGIFWLCSFSIPIITFCAFICLNIFLTLFDIVFSWMAWFRICVPIPVPKDDE